MEKPTYWLDLFTGKTWSEFLKAGAEISGFRESRWNTAKKFKIGDYLLCYLTGVSRFIGILEICSKAFLDKSPIWEDEDFPCRVKVKPIIKLTPETAVPVMELKEALSCFKISDSPHAWTGRFRGSPSKWSKKDGEAVLNALQDAQDNPVKRPVDPKKLARRPRSLKAKIGSVTIPDSEIDNKVSVKKATKPSIAKDATEHTEIQALLLKLGSDMGFDVWVARNDRSKEIKENKLEDFARVLHNLPLQFDDATNKTIELIDVLWLKQNAIVSAFEIESTTSIYSGLLRMSDLLAMQPNINIPLYLVAPDERRNKVISEVNRPTFSQLKPPLSEVCRYISFSTLRKEIDKIKPILRYIKPEYLDEMSESCEPEE
jgi:EVE domain-containing protein